MMQGGTATRGGMNGRNPGCGWVHMWVRTGGMEAVSREIHIITQTLHVIGHNDILRSFLVISTPSLPCPP